MLYSLDEAQRLCDLLNQKLKDLPRVVGNIVLNQVPTTIAELNQPYREHNPVAPGPGPFELNENAQLYWQNLPGGGVTHGLPELLSACCVPGVMIQLCWTDEGPRLEAVKQY